MMISVTCDRDLCLSAGACGSNRHSPQKSQQKHASTDAHHKPHGAEIEHSEGEDQFSEPAISARNQLSRSHVDLCCLV